MSFWPDFSLQLGSPDAPNLRMLLPLRTGWKARIRRMWVPKTLSTQSDCNCQACVASLTSEIASIFILKSVKPLSRLPRMACS